jgi:leader peptidase (prepilin peptidase) / N-methyltransferase
LFETLAFFLVGLCLGSFANVLIYRVPLGTTFKKSRSHCPSCDAQIAWYDNIPVISFILLWRKCRHCQAKIAWRYPLVELLVAFGFAGLYLHLGFCWTLLEYLIFYFSLITVSFIDFDHMILPDVFTLSGIVIGLLGAALNPERNFVSSLTGVLIGGGFLWLVAYLYFVIRGQEGMGGGDIKLLGWIGALLGWTSIPFVILFSSIVGSVVGILVAIRSKGNMSTSIPFGPYLALAAIVLMFGGDKLSLWYLHLFLPTLGQP